MYTLHSVYTIYMQVSHIPEIFHLFYRLLGGVWKPASNEVGIFYEGCLLFFMSFIPFDCPDSWYVSHHQGVCCSCYSPDSWSGKFWKTKCSMFMFVFRVVTFLQFSPELPCTWPSLLYSFSPRSPLPLAKQLTHLPSLRGYYFCTIPNHCFLSAPSQAWCLLVKTVWRMWWKKRLQ